MRRLLFFLWLVLDYDSKIVKPDKETKITATLWREDASGIKGQKTVNKWKIIIGRGKWIFLSFWFWDFCHFFRISSKRIGWKWAIEKEITILVFCSKTLVGCPRKFSKFFPCFFENKVLKIGKKIREKN